MKRFTKAQYLQWILIFLTTLITLYFSLRLSKEFLFYYPLKARIEATVTQWEIEEIDHRFAIRAIYSFEGAPSQGTFLFPPPYHWNEPSALAALKLKAKESHYAWYNPSNLAHSALEKTFPTGLLLRTILCYLVLIYFFLIKSRILKTFTY